MNREKLEDLIYDLVHDARGVGVASQAGSSRDNSEAVKQETKSRRALIDFILENSNG